MSAPFAHAILHFIIGEHGAERRTPVHPSFAQVREAEAQQDLLLDLFLERLPFAVGEGAQRFFFLVAGDGTFILSAPSLFLKARDQFADRFCFLRHVIIPTIEELQEDPLRPLVVGRVARAHLA